LNTSFTTYTSSLQYHINRGLTDNKHAKYIRRVWRYQKSNQNR